MKKLAVFFFALFAALSVASSCDAASPVRLHVLSVSLTNGAAVVEGQIINEREKAVNIGGAELIVKLTDANGDALIDDVYRFEGIGVTILANDSDVYTFTLSNEDLPAYDGRFQWRIQSKLKWKEA